MNKQYEVVIKGWVDGSGFSYESTYDWLDEECTAKEYINSLDPDYAFTVPEDGDLLVEIRLDDEVISECWVSEA